MYSYGVSDARSDRIRQQLREPVHFGHGLRRVNETGPPDNSLESRHAPAVQRYSEIKNRGILNIPPELIGERKS